MTGTGYVVTGGGGTVSWGDVQGKPEEFPPSDHSHAYGEITEKPSTFPPSVHSHDYAAPDHAHPAASWSSVTGKPSTFPPDAHGHAIAEVTDLATQLAEPARVYVHNGTAYVLSTTTDIFIGPEDPGSGLWVDTNA